MDTKDAEILTELVAAFSTVIAETTRAIARQSNGSVSRHLIALELEQSAKKLPSALKYAKDILGSIAAQLDDKTYPQVVIQATPKK